MKLRNSRLGRPAAVAVTALLLCAPAWAATDTGTAGAGHPESAVWTPKELRFVFQGFTAHYSCDGLQDKIRRVLLEWGARKDVQVRQWGCSTPFGRPDPFPGVYIRMNVLQPAEGGAAAAKAIPAHWKRIELHLDRDPVWEAGDCELVEQFKQSILPLFTTRNIEYRSNCVPYQLTVGGTSLSAEVLVADQKDAKALASQ